VKKINFLEWVTDKFFPWLNWFFASLVNGVLFVILLGVAFMGGVHFVEGRLEQKSVQALCIEAFSVPDAKFEVISKKDE
jgi:hypothetical protein